MKASGHLLALVKILDCVQGGNTYNDLCKKILDNKKALQVFRRDKVGDFLYIEFLKEKITAAVSKSKAKKVKTENFIKELSELSNLKSQFRFFSVKDFRENCKDLKDAGAISDADYENIKQIFKKSLTYETVVEVSKKLLQALIENAGAQNIDLEAIKTEAGPESENSKSLYVLVKTQLNSEKLTNLVEKEDEEEALSDDGDSIEEESEEIEAKSDKKAEKLVDFVKEVITRYQSQASETLDGVLGKLNKKSTTDELNNIKNSLVILPAYEERRISMRLNDMRFFRLAQARGKENHEEELDSYDNDELQKLVVTENEVIEAESNIFDVLVESGQFEKNEDKNDQSVLTKESDKKAKNGSKIREDKDFDEVVKGGNITRIREYLKAKYKDFIQIVKNESDACADWVEKNKLDRSEAIERLINPV